MRLTALAIASFPFITIQAMAAAPQPTGTYGIHLHFDEKEYVDEMTLARAADGSLKGTMHVPNDFDGTLDQLVVADGRIDFDLFVPKDPRRPKDLVFHYQGQFFDASCEQLIGYVRIKGEPGFVASFVGFKRAEKP